LEETGDQVITGFDEKILTGFIYSSLDSIYLNLFNTRQLRWEPMHTGSIQNPDFREIYTPADRFIFNGDFGVTL
jgi:iron complex outermembrane receptor protein